MQIIGSIVGFQLFLNEMALSSVFSMNGTLEPTRLVIFSQFVPIWISKNFPARLLGFTGFTKNSPWYSPVHLLSMELRVDLILSLTITSYWLYMFKYFCNKTIASLVYLIYSAFHLVAHFLSPEMHGLCNINSNWKLAVKIKWSLT